MRAVVVMREVVPLRNLALRLGSSMGLRVMLFQGSGWPGDVGMGWFWSHVRACPLLLPANPSAVPGHSSLQLAGSSLFLPICSSFSCVCRWW